MERFSGYVFEDYLTPRVLKERAISYELCPLFTYSLDYWEVYKHFSEEGDFYGRGGYVEGSFHEGRARFPSISEQELRAQMTLVTRQEELRAKSSYGMSTNKILRINRLI